MHTWSKNDAARVRTLDASGKEIFKVFRALSVTRENLPAVKIGTEIVMATKPDEWDHVGRYEWTLNPMTPGGPFLKFVPCE